MGTTPFLFASFLNAFSVLPSAAGQAPPVALPPAMAIVQQFRGRIEYLARRASNGTAVRGTFSLTESGWSLDEIAGDRLLHAGSDGNSYRAGAMLLTFDDPLKADPLANAWTAALPLIAGDGWSPTDALRRIWVGGASKVRLYLDTTGERITSLALDPDSESVSFVFGGWMSAGGLYLPQKITRVRGGREDSTFFVDRYDVARQPTIEPRADLRSGGSLSAPEKPASTAALHPMAHISGERALLQFMIAIALLLLGLAACAWIRRDALFARWGARIAADPTRWRHAGTSIFVSSEGVLYFDGCRYRVGSEFYGRLARVQTSPLFVRVSAPGTPRVVVLARKFRSLMPVRPTASIGFSLAEVMIAMTLFALVVTAAVYPALVVVAQGEGLAQERATAIRLAANALADQQNALAYTRYLASSSAASAIVEGMRVGIERHPSPTGPDLIDLTVTVSNAHGRVLARAVTTIGPPVPTPAPTGAN